ncbi:hypothetical protein PHMEG_00027765 [Phytophthora megakarya]|uniref:Uncharacterized protein n=1 Tax=Phytophthora megakarya TaxID=4795 RepID=A0A225V731_9STRA|nr:hypothetical protein PHMEG_00027765 [Phytophthora megakarya]
MAAAGSRTSSTCRYCDDLHCDWMRYHNDTIGSGLRMLTRAWKARVSHHVKKALLQRYYYKKLGRMS